MQIPTHNTRTLTLEIGLVSVILPHFGVVYSHRDEELSSLKEWEVEYKITVTELKRRSGGQRMEKG